MGVKFCVEESVRSEYGSLSLVSVRTALFHNSYRIHYHRPIRKAELNEILIPMFSRKCVAVQIEKFGDCISPLELFSCMFLLSSNNQPFEDKLDALLTLFQFRPLPVLTSDEFGKFVPEEEAFIDDLKLMIQCLVCGLSKLSVVPFDVTDEKINSICFQLFAAFPACAGSVRWDDMKSEIMSSQEINVFLRQAVDLLWLTPITRECYQVLDRNPVPSYGDSSPLRSSRGSLSSAISGIHSKKLTKMILRSARLENRHTEVHFYVDYLTEVARASSSVELERKEVEIINLCLEATVDASNRVNVEVIKYLRDSLLAFNVVAKSVNRIVGAKETVLLAHNSSKPDVVQSSRSFNKSPGISPSFRGRQTRAVQQVAGCYLVSLLRLAVSCEYILSKYKKEMMLQELAAAMGEMGEAFISLNGTDPIPGDNASQKESPTVELPSFVTICQERELFLSYFRTDALSTVSSGAKDSSVPLSPRVSSSTALAQSTARFIAITRPFWLRFRTSTACLKLHLPQLHTEEDDDEAIVQLEELEQIVRLRLRIAMTTAGKTANQTVGQKVVLPESLEISPDLLPVWEEHILFVVRLFFEECGGKIRDDNAEITMVATLASGGSSLQKPTNDSSSGVKWRSIRLREEDLNRHLAKLCEYHRVLVSS